MGRYIQKAYKLDEMPLMDVGDLSVFGRAKVKANGFFSHGPLQWEDQTAKDLTFENVVQPYLGAKVVLLVRHPMDAIVSLYMHERFQKNQHPYKGSVMDMVEDPVFGLEKFFQFYCLWSEHHKKAHNFHIWRYEDAQLNPNETFGNLLKFLEEPIDQNLVQDATEYASFSNMKALEASGDQPVYKSSGLPIFATGDAANPDAHHVRKGQVGGWRREVSPSDAALLEARIGGALSSFYGYN